MAKDILDYESLGDRINAIGILYESFIITNRSNGGLSNDGVFSEVVMALSDLCSMASKDAKELFDGAYRLERRKDTHEAS